MNLWNKKKKVKQPTFFINDYPMKNNTEWQMYLKSEFGIKNTYNPY